MKRNMWWLAVLVLFTVPGCMGGRTLNLDAHYDMARSPKASFSTNGLKVAVIPFEDATGTKEIGQWTGLRGKVDRLMLKQPVDDTVTSAVVDYLKKTGLDVSIVQKGTSPESFVNAPPHLVVSGVVDELTTEADSRIGYTQVRTRVSLKVRITNVKDGSSISQAIESVSKPRTVVAFNRSVFEDTLNEALSDGLDLILQRVNLEKGELRLKR